MTASSPSGLFYPYTLVKPQGQLGVSTRHLLGNGSQFLHRDHIILSLGRDLHDRKRRRFARHGARGAETHIPPFSPGGTAVMHTIPPEVFTSTCALIFLIASIPACSALPDGSVIRLKKRSNTLALGVSPLHVCTSPREPALRAIGRSDGVEDARAVTSSERSLRTLDRHHS